MNEVEAEKNELMRRARDLALRRISQREYSSAELLAYLKRKNIDLEIATQVVDRIVQDGWIDDQRYVKIMARHQMMRGKGPSYTVAKLRQKGMKVDLAAVKSALSEIEGVNELETARQIVERKYPTAYQDRKESMKAYQTLIRRGFSHEIARKAVRPPSPDDDLI